MFKEAIERELVYPTELKSKLLELGLKGVEITADELFYADDLSSKYRRLSVFDRIAIAIAKKRHSAANRRWCIKKCSYFRKC